MLSLRTAPVKGPTERLEVQEKQEEEKEEKKEEKSRRGHAHAQAQVQVESSNESSDTVRACMRRVHVAGATRPATPSAQERLFLRLRRQRSWLQCCRECFGRYSEPELSHGG